jgi:succinoglycan biosynthesis protein ExoM
MSTEAGTRQPPEMPRTPGLYGQHISVCVCTYRRPRLLTHLLGALERQETGEKFGFDVVIVDNDASESGREAVDSFRAASNIRISYFVEPQQNISMARNRAVAAATGDLVALIDDDESPGPMWLHNLYAAFTLYASDGVLGSVRPRFEGKPPGWLVKSRICERPSHRTGSRLRFHECRTGNALLDKRLFGQSEVWFRPEFGRTGGEDVEFFREQIAQGRVFVWCEEAPVWEIVSRLRWRRLYYLERYLRIGGLSGEKVRRTELRYVYLARTAANFGLSFWGVVLGALVSEGTSFRFLVKFAHSAGWLLGFCGLVVLRNRTD